MKKKTKVVSLTLAAICLIVATYRSAKNLDWRDASPVSDTVTSENRNKTERAQRKGEKRAPTKSLRESVNVTQDLNSEVDLEKIDSDLMLVRLPSDYMPQRGEGAYLEDVGEVGGVLEVQTFSSSAGVVLLRFGDELEGRLTQGA